MLARLSLGRPWLQRSPGAGQWRRCVIIDLEGLTKSGLTVDSGKKEVVNVQKGSVLRGHRVSIIASSGGDFGSYSSVLSLIRTARTHLEVMGSALESERVSVTLPRSTPTGPLARRS